MVELLYGLLIAGSRRQEQSVMFLHSGDKFGTIGPKLEAGHAPMPDSSARVPVHR